MTSEPSSHLISKAATALEAALEFARIAGNSGTTGIAPRQSDPAIEELLARVFDTSSLQLGSAYPMSEFDALYVWHCAVVNAGRIYLTAGTETGLSDSGNALDRVRQTDRNVVKFAREMGRGIDAQIRLRSALVETLSSFLTNASETELAEYLNIKSAWATHQSGYAHSITATMCLLVVDGLSDSRRRERLVTIGEVASQVAKSLTTEDLKLLRGITREAAARLAHSALRDQLRLLAEMFEPSAR